MSRTFSISDTAYETLKEIAERQGRSPEAVVEGWSAASGVSDRPRYGTEDWFRHLGMSEERIREARADREDREERGENDVYPG